jgi:DNA-binding response OmpR family regulator
VEDDASIALGLRINLESEGYEVFCAEDGDRGLSMAREQRPDLILLDVMLPKTNGLEVLRAIRQDGLHIPIIVLSARTAEMDKVAGLELGAEDYVAKPFSLAELLARIRGALRRRSRADDTRPPPNLRNFGDVRVDLGARTVTRKGTAVEITATEFDVLACLMEAPGVALSREAIFLRVWGPNHHGTPRTIDNFIQQLRAKLEPDPQRPRHVVTVRGIGYRFDG